MSLCRFVHDCRNIIKDPLLHLCLAADFLFAKVFRALLFVLLVIRCERNLELGSGHVVVRDNPVVHCIPFIEPVPNLLDIFLCARVGVGDKLACGNGAVGLAYKINVGEGVHVGNFAQLK